MGVQQNHMTDRDSKFKGVGGISGPYDVTTFKELLHKYFSLKHVLGDTQHVCMMIISNHANPLPCFLEQLGEVPFVDMVFMHGIELNKSFGFVSHLQPRHGGGGGGGG